MSRIRSNTRQSGVFDSVQKPGGASDGRPSGSFAACVLPTIAVRVLEKETQAIAQCRRLLASGCDGEAQALWKGLINVAKEGRLRSRTITVRTCCPCSGQFGLLHHPDFDRDWKTLFNITADHKARIETELPSGYAVRGQRRSVARKQLSPTTRSRWSSKSGSGKSALVKSVLDGAYPSWNQVWFGPEELKAGA